MAKQEDIGAWTRLTPENDIRTIVGSSQGLPGGGKSHFWMTAPGPIAWFLFDPGGLKGLRDNPVFKSKEVFVRDFAQIVNVGKYPKMEDRIKMSIDAFNTFQEEWDFILPKVRTAVIDKESLFWEVIRYAFDEVASPIPKNFHELNLLYRGWVQDAENQRKNLGMLRDMSDTWGKIGVNERTGKPQMGFTGNYRPDGQKHVTGLVQINMEHRWNVDARKFEVEILPKCRLGSAEKLIGKVEQNLSFPDLAMMLYPESDVSDWEDA
jgi:hypothetical protein